MKTCLLLLGAFAAGTAFGQIPGPVPPQTGPWVTARGVPHQNQVRQATPPPVGFWVIEEQPKQRAMAHFYANNRQQLRTDTLRQKHLNLKSRAVVVRLNKRLTTALTAQSAPASVAVLRP